MKRFELERAISENELVLHYQRWSAFRVAQLNAVEALVRGGIRSRPSSPLEFMPEVEARGSGPTAHVLGSSRRVAASNVWRQDGTALDVAVNLSVENLTTRNSGGSPSSR